ncbi:hypothetical protein AB4144_59690, partial [Rhizobiaceae sp. 2RAB30]
MTLRAVARRTADNSARPLVDEPTPFVAAEVARRGFYDAATKKRSDIAVYDRASLAPGATLAGPAVITEAETTTVVTRSFNATIDVTGAIRLTAKKG